MRSGSSSGTLRPVTSISYTTPARAAGPPPARCASSAEYAVRKTTGAVTPLAAANASTPAVAATVATPLEQEINGVDEMLYMSSYASGDGALTLTITFRLGTNLDDAQVLVNTVNCVGRMGKGVALSMKTAFPAILEPYQKACEA